MAENRGAAPANGRVNAEGIGVTDLQHFPAPTPVRQHVFRAPEIWLILQMMEAMEPMAGVPPEAGFDTQALADARVSLLRQGLLRADELGGVRLTYAAYELVLPSAFPESVIVASITERGAADTPGRTICFSRNGDSVVVNWVDARGDHYFQAYPQQDAGACVLGTLLNLCDLHVTPPTASQQVARRAALPEPDLRDLERAVGQMKQAVSLMAMKGVGTPAQVTRAAGWFVGGGQAWLMPAPQKGRPGVPHPASLEEVAQAVLGLVEQVIEGS